MPKEWQVLIMIVAVIIVAHVILSTIQPFIPAIILLTVVITIGMRAWNRHRRW